MKNIALFIDGTWQASKEKTNNSTNVFRLFHAAHETEQQTIRYLRGIGTHSQPLLNIVPGLTGKGTANRIREAYQFLSQSYEDGDRVFLFGFSRGAFAARSLAGFVDAVGLLLKDFADQPRNVDAAFDLYRNATDPQQSGLRNFLRHMTGVEQPAEGQILPIYFIGVWDTVGALGLPLRLQKFSAPFTEYHQPQLPSNVTHARHALALHELRDLYEPLLWTGVHPRANAQSLQQVWFPGAHADVGGGYAETAIADIALHWMAEEASDAGLELERKVAPPNDTSLYKVHHEVRGIFGCRAPKTRSALARANLTTKIAETYSFHESALLHFGVEGNRRYKFSQSINGSLSAADTAGLQLYLHLGDSRPSKILAPAFRTVLGNGRRSAPKVDPWHSIRVEDLPSWRPAVEHYLRTSGEPSADEQEQFYRTLRPWLAIDPVAAFQCVRTEASAILEKIRGSATLEEARAWALRLSHGANVLERCVAGQSDAERTELKSIVELARSGPLIELRQRLRKDTLP